MRRAAPLIALVLVLAVIVVVVVASVGGGSGGYRVEALFDNAGFAVPGEQVRIAGAPVGTISALSVTKQNLAAVTLSISNRDFVPFYANATCTIRPQSLIAERYVDCAPGTSSQRRLRRITSGYGQGSYLLPVTQTSSPIDPDIVQDVSQESVRESLSVILNELGTGLAGRGSDLNAVILRADPALAQTERVFNLLASQNKVLAKLATDSDTVLAPLAKTRSSLADFVVQANKTATASAAERTQLASSIRLLPSFLKQLKPLMADLGQLADQGTPVVKDAGSSAAALDTEFKTLVPFADRARTAIVHLGNAAQQSESSLDHSQGLAAQFRSVGNSAEPSSQSLHKLLSSLDSSGGFTQLMSLLFYGTGATNGYNADGHYIRLSPVVGSCTAYARAPIPGCSANFSGASATQASSAAVAVARKAVRQVLGHGGGKSKSGGSKSGGSKSGEARKRGARTDGLEVGQAGRQLAGRQAAAPRHLDERRFVRWQRRWGPRRTAELPDRERFAMIRRRGTSPFSNPVLIGALAVLVMVVAVVLAFQANNGLPYVPRYTLHIEASNAEELVHGAEVHMGGALIGNVTQVTAARDGRGQPIAVIDAELDKSVEPLPVDTHFAIRMKSSIGDKYLEVTLGHSRRTWRNGATVPLGHTSSTVDLDQVLDMYTPSTQNGVADTTLGFGQALAGRGQGLNQAIGAFVPLVSSLTPVMRNLASQRTNLKGFLGGLGAFVGALAPVSRQQAELYAGLDTTFKALAGVAKPYLQDWIEQTPPTFQAVVSDGPAIGSFAKDTGQLFADLKPGFATLPKSTPQLAAALEAGVKTLPGTARFDRQTVGLARALEQFGVDSTVKAGLARLALATGSLTKPLQFLAPAQTSCNYVTLFLRNLASSLSDNIGTGTVLRFVLVAIDNDIAGGEAAPSSTPYTSTSLAGGNKHGPLHFDPYPNTDSPGEVAECSAGKEPYSPSQAVIGNPTKNVGAATEKTKR